MTDPSRSLTGQESFNTVTIPDDGLLTTLTGNGAIQVKSLLPLLMPASASVAFGIRGLDGRYLLANRELQRLLGGTNQTIDGRSEREFLPPPVLAQMEPCDQRILRSLTATFAEVELSDNGENRQYLWLKLPILDTNGTLQGMASIVYEEPTHRESSSMQQAVHRLQQANRELRRAVHELEQTAGTDKLTGAWNRHRLEESVRREMDRLHRYEQPLSLLLLDVDHFKIINDLHGHVVGDQILVTISSLLHGNLRGSDALARWGGEEFIVVCPNSRLARAMMLAERLRQQVAATAFPTVSSVTVSIGVAECVVGDTWESWFQRADQALYRAKNNGRNQVRAATIETPHMPGEQKGFVRLVWNSAYECGHEIIDNGHKQLFTRANDLLTAILSGFASEQTDGMVDDLIADVVEHFSAEETVFLATKFPEAVAHIAQHRHLTAKTRNLLGGYRSGQCDMGDVFQFLAHEVIAQHMLGADRSFFPFLSDCNRDPVA